MTSPIVLVWENFGPTHEDRCEALAHHFNGEREIIGIELASRSNTYSWHRESRSSFRKITLFQSRIAEVSLANRICRTLTACLKSRAEIFFFCHYEHFATFTVAMILRILRKTVIVMNDSKFDDYDRYLWRELLKSAMLLPYWGGLAAGRRSMDYMHFMGISRARIAGNYDSLSVSRMRRLAGAVPAPAGAPFSDRCFAIIARLVSKKNLFMALEAYSIYAAGVKHPRPLEICGSGPLEPELRRVATAKGLENVVKFHGLVQSDTVSRVLGQSLALILPSIEEQFGLVVIEALAMGVPILASDRCGARDELIRTGVNGFIIEPDNPSGLAFFMKLIHEDEALWRQMSSKALVFAEKGDAARFAEAASDLVKLAYRT